MGEEPFSVSPFLFVLSFSVCFLCRLVRFSFRFPAHLGGGFCPFFLVLQPPRAACEPACMRIPLVYCLLAFLLFIYFIFFCSFPFFDFDLDVVCSILSFSCAYYAVSSVLVLLRLVKRMIRTGHVHTLISTLFLCEVQDFVSVFELLEPVL